MRSLLHFLLCLIGIAMLAGALITGALVDHLSDGQQGCLFVLGLVGLVIAGAAGEEI